MFIYVIKIKIHIPWSHSLKEKRMVVKSICSKVRNNFNVSISEVDEQDIHQMIVLAYSFVTTDNRHGDSIYEHTIQFIEGITEGEIISIEKEIY